MQHAIANLNSRTKLILVVLCLAIGLGNTYIPLPVAIEKDLSIPFPCQAKGCGCADAYQCWSKCCCHSDAEKLAWAKQNGVAPPVWFLEKVKYTKSLPSKAKSKCCCCKKSKPAPSISTASKSCCSSKKRKCCSAKRAAAQAAGSCCSSKMKSCCCDKEVEVKEAGAAIDSQSHSQANSPQHPPTRTVRMTLKEQRGCNGDDDGLAELNLELVPLDLEPDSKSIQSEALCHMELSFKSFWPSPPEPIPE